MIFNKEMVGGRERVTTDEKRYCEVRPCEGVEQRSDCYASCMFRPTGCKNFVGIRES